MKKFAFSFLLMFLELAVFAQQVKPIYFIGDSVVLDSKKATSYGVYGKLSNEDFYRIKIFDLNDNLLVTGAYQDEKMQVPTGRFLYYAFVDDFNYENDENFYVKGSYRYLSKQGDYLNGIKVGRWVAFFPDGKIRSIENYLNGAKSGKYQMFTRRGKVEIDGNYLADQMEGKWIYDTGKIEFYANGVLISIKYN